jgi:hypothetical protein
MSMHIWQDRHKAALLSKCKLLYRYGLICTFFFKVPGPTVLFKVRNTVRLRYLPVSCFFLFFGNGLKCRGRMQVQPGGRAAVPPDHPRRPRGTRSVPRPAPRPTIRSKQQAEIRAKRASGASSTARPLTSYPLRSRKVPYPWMD